MNRAGKHTYDNVQRSWRSQLLIYVYKRNHRAGQWTMVSNGKHLVLIQWSRWNAWWTTSGGHQCLPLNQQKRRMRKKRKNNKGNWITSGRSYLPWKIFDEWTNQGLFAKIIPTAAFHQSSYCGVCNCIYTWICLFTYIINISMKCISHVYI